MSSSVLRGGVVAKMNREGVYSGAKQSGRSSRLSCWRPSSSISGRGMARSSCWRSAAVQLRPATRSSRVAVSAFGAQKQSSIVRAASVDLDESAPFLDPFVRTFCLGVGAGMLLEGGHVMLQFLSGNPLGSASFTPLLFADHVAALASWICLYAVEAAAVMAVLKRFNYDPAAAARDLASLVTPSRRMLPLRLTLFKRFFVAGARLADPFTVAAAATTAALPTTSGPAQVPALPAAQASTTSAFIASTPVAPEPTTPALVTIPEPTAVPVPSKQPPIKARGANTVVPAPKGRRLPGLPPPPPPAEQPERDQASINKRMKELRDREGYLRNMWYAVGFSHEVDKKPVKTQLCGKEMVLFRDENDKVHCIDNTCPHRGAPLSEGWVERKEDHSCVVCPYHGWALDGQGLLKDVPAAANKGEWPKRPLVDSWPVEEKGGFIWLFYGSKSLPAEERPPIPFVPELEDPTWRPVYEQIEFDANHFGVFENAIDMAHIHYLHSDSFGNQSKPEIRDMTTTSDAFSVTANFVVHNKAVNAFWEMFSVPEVHVMAKAFLPSTSVVTFELGGGLNFTTFVSTVPISANKSINRFALVRKLSSDKTGIFNAPVWDGMARNAMLKIQMEDKEMVEQLKYDQLPAEYSVRADLPQIMFRKLRQQYVDMGYGVPTEKEVPPFASNPIRDQ